MESARPNLFTYHIDIFYTSAQREIGGNYWKYLDKYILCALPRNKWVISIVLTIVHFTYKLKIFTYFPQDLEFLGSNPAEIDGFFLDLKVLKEGL